MLFCPTCGNLLLVEESATCLRFSCSTCPYISNIKRKISTRIYPKLKVRIHDEGERCFFVVVCSKKYLIS